MSYNFSKLVHSTIFDLTIIDKYNNEMKNKET
jgi:hypothetical protein